MVKRRNTEDEPSFTMYLRVSAATAAILDAHCDLALAKSREEMSEIWIARWATYDSLGPAFVDSDEPGSVIGRSRVKILESYQQQPVPLTVTIDGVTRHALLARSGKERVPIEQIASAVVNEHGEHFADDLRRQEAGLGYVPEGRKPCWCFDSPTLHRRGA